MHDTSTYALASEKQMGADKPHLLPSVFMNLLPQVVVIQYVVLEGADKKQKNKPNNSVELRVEN
jgi:hypothetical protein